MKKKKEQVFTMATMFYVVREIIAKLKKDTVVDPIQVDTLVFNNIVKHTQK